MATAGAGKTQHWRDRLRVDQPLEMWEVLAEEFERDGSNLPPEFDQLADAYDASGKDPGKRHELEQELFRIFLTGQVGPHKPAPEGFAGRSALCFSGGGVRSATFGLGVLQGLAACMPASPIPKFDFLSTVSGGGYVGSWFSAWASRLEAENKKVDGPQAVVDELKKSKTSLDPEPEPMLHIRRYCAFLTPKLGLLSADAWTLAATIARNMILNWLIIVPLIMAAILLPTTYRALLDVPADAFVAQAALWLGGFGIVLGTRYVIAHLPRFRKTRNPDDDMAFILKALLPLAAGALLLSLHWAWRIHAHSENYEVWKFALFGAGFHAAGWSLVFLTSGDLKSDMFKFSKIVGGLLAAGISGLLAGWLVFLVSTAFADDLTGRLEKVYAAVAIPVILGAFLAAAVLAVGLASRITGDDDRESWSRAGAWIMIVMFAWLTVTFTVFFGPFLLKAWHTKLAAWIGTVGFGGVVSRLGFSPSTIGGGHGNSSQEAESSPKNVLAKLSAPAFLWLLMVVLAIADYDLRRHLGGWLPWLPHPDTSNREVMQIVSEAWVFAGLVVVALLAAAYVNINRFSLHAMYRARLIRTYLGASRKDRKKSVNRFIDMDEADNVYMSRLSTRRPLHVVNMALNLVGGENLAWQQRKAESFTSTRLRTGSLRIGYRSSATCTTPNEGGLSLGSAMAVSGAAASPNMGYHSSPVVTFIMALFNARLGWWLGNPRLDDGSWTKDGPRFAFIPMLREALGKTDDLKRWVYLSDGGHFENLGLYEMVLRRCRNIVVVDGSQDADYNFEDLGNAIRKIRVDLGVAISFDQVFEIHGSRDAGNRYCAMATIYYGHPDDKDTVRGTLLYLKACLNGTEPEDVLNYAACQHAFPQQGTEELWFNEAQFESYRRLGAHIIERFSACADPALTDPVAQLMDAARKYAKQGLETRWEKPAKTSGKFAGSLGGAPLELNADLLHHLNS